MNGDMAQMSGMKHDSMGGMVMEGNRTMNMNMDMKMYFHFGTDETILFKGWKTDNAGELFGSMLAVATMAFLFETIRVLQLKLSTMSVKKLSVFLGRQKGGQEAKVELSEEVEDSAWYKQSESSNDWRLPQMTFADRLGHALLKMVQFALGYILMLLFMLYNVWLCLAIILGFGIGFAAYYNLRKQYMATEKGLLLKMNKQAKINSSVELKETLPPSDNITY